MIEYQFRLYWLDIYRSIIARGKISKSVNQESGYLFINNFFKKCCDGQGNTITIIKKNLNNIFGGYASSAWHSSKYFDPDAFLFRLRRDGVSFKDKFTDKKPEFALNWHSNYGPRFGGNDIFICNQSDTNMGSFCYFGSSYNLPDGYIYGGNAKEFLTGNYIKWTTTEI